MRIAEATAPEQAPSELVAASSEDAEFTKLKSEPSAKNLTKFANVKSGRISWTAERRQLLEDMWNKGDSATAIAAALGCKVGLVSVARARFGLKPRREASGRPKQHHDEPAHRIERVAFHTSRLMEFCTAKELVAQTGHEAYYWPHVVVKELVDNAIDAAEEAEVAPVIKVTVTSGTAKVPTRIVIEDNGPGIPPTTVVGILDYNVRVSTKEAIISPTRGRQGNALKTILPMAYVLTGSEGETWIEARGVKHRIVFRVNQIKQDPLVEDSRSRSAVKVGTRVTVFWPYHDRIKIDPHEVWKLLVQFIDVNPHLSVRLTVDDKIQFEHAATNPDWVKYRTCDATSAHWYRLEQFERYAGALIAREQEGRKGRRTRQKITVREFAAQFRGMSATEKQKQVVGELGVSHMSLARFFGSETHVNHDRMQNLLTLLRKHTRPVRPELLGVIGEAHLRKVCVDLDGEDKSFKYFCSAGQDAAGGPYVVEIANCASRQWVAGQRQVRNRVLITGVNFSATLTNPFTSLRGVQGIEGLLEELRAGPYAPVVVVVHYASPHVEYLDRGKSRIGLE